MMAVFLQKVRTPHWWDRDSRFALLQVFVFLGVAALLCLPIQGMAQSEGENAPSEAVVSNANVTNAPIVLPESSETVVPEATQTNLATNVAVTVSSLSQPHEPFLYARPVIRRSDITAEGNEREKRLMEWIMDRAEEGSISAQYELGIRYLSGKGVVKNEDLGRGWLQKAAKLGDMDAYEKFKNTDFEKEIVDKEGRVVQSTDARRRFMEQSGYPQGRIGYVICHMVPVYNGGLDTVENMVWRPINEAFAQEPWNLRGWINNSD